MNNFQAEVCRYQQNPKAIVVVDKLRLDNFSYVNTQFNHCFIIF